MKAIYLGHNIARTIKIIFLFPGLFFFHYAHSQELEPRSYINIPVGLNFVALAYGYTDGDIYTAPSVPIEDLALRVDGPLLAYGYTFGMFGRSTKFDFSVGRMCGFASAIFEGDNISRKFCGVTDTKVRLNYNFYGSPALTLKEFGTYKRDIVVGASFQINVPTGKYDTDYFFNVGSNRWYYKPEIGLSIPYRKWEFDFAVSAKIFGDNTELKKTFTLSQDPIYNLQLHIIYYIVRGQWIALDSNYFRGGDTYRNGSRSTVTSGNYRGGVTYSYAFNWQHSIKLLAHKGVSTRLGNDSVVYGLAWAYTWN
ncbi:MAG: transporter [Thiohalomonadales bacterium]